MPNVVDTIVTSDLCVGCGICVSVCPDNNLEIRTNIYGEYNPFLKQRCLNECGLCYKICPFGNGNPKENEIGKEKFGTIPDMLHDQATGYYLTSFVGNVTSEHQRERSASGGLATWLLTMLLRENIIDGAICVSPSNEPDTLFKYAVARSIESIESSSGSAYYPVQLSNVISYIMTTPGRYAITTLPCFAKSIRLAQMRNKILRERIVYIIGITCGQMKSKHYTDYLTALSGVNGKVSKAHYRGKDKSQPANNYYFSCENSIGEDGKVFWNEGVSEAWLSRWFTLNSCNYCDDVFAECADVVCMDAWLPENIVDWRGTSLVLIRNPKLLDMVRAGMEHGEIAINLVPIDKVKQSQSGLIVFKRQDLRTRLWLAEKERMKIPEKRITAKWDFNQINIMETQILIEIQKRSKERYLEWQTGNGLNLAPFRKSLIQYQRKLKLLQKGMAISKISLAAIGRLRKKHL